MVQTEPVHVDLAGVDDACLRPDLFTPRHGFITSAEKMRHEEKHLEESPDANMGEKWKDQVFIPTGADKMTVMFYKWFRRNGPIPWKPGNDKMPEIGPRRI